MLTVTTFRTLGLQKEAEIEATDNQINQLNQSKEKKATTNNLKASLGVQTNQVQTRTWVVQAGKDWHDPDSQESREFEISPELWQELLSTRYFFWKWQVFFNCNDLKWTK